VASATGAKFAQTDLQRFNGVGQVTLMHPYPRKIIRSPKCVCEKCLSIDLSVVQSVAIRNDHRLRGHYFKDPLCTPPKRLYATAETVMRKLLRLLAGELMPHILQKQIVGSPLDCF
jgi:hypothetical protein